MADSYVTLDEFKSYVGVGSNVDDDELQRSLDATSAWVEEWTGRRFGQSGSESRDFYLRGSGSVWIDDLASLTSAALGDGISASYATTLTDDVDFILLPVNAASHSPEARPYTGLKFVNRTFATAYAYRPQLRLTGVWGWPETPPAVQEAVVLQASRMFKRRYSPEGVLNGFEGFGPIRVGTRLDPDVEILLKEYRRQPARQVR